MEDGWGQGQPLRLLARLPDPQARQNVGRIWGWFTGHHRMGNVVNFHQWAHLLYAGDFPNKLGVGP